MVSVFGVCRYKECSEEDGEKCSGDRTIRRSISCVSSTLMLLTLYATEGKSTKTHLFWCMRNCAESPESQHHEHQ